MILFPFATPVYRIVEGTRKDREMGDVFVKMILANPEFDS